MKHSLLLLPLGLLAAPAFGQKVEYSIQATGNLAQYAGSTAVAATNINDANGVTGAIRTGAVNPYGTNTGFGGGLGVRAQYATSFHLLAAFGLGYELYNARTDATGVNYASSSNGSITYIYSAGTGTVHLYTQAATAFAGIGARLGGGEHNAALDLLVGPELEYLTAAHEQGEGTSGRGSWSTDLKRSSELDNRLGFRLRGELTLWIKKVGVLGGYSYGFTNHMPVVNNVAPDAQLRVIRAGLAYRFNR